jgi:hypothetical protein
VTVFFLQESAGKMLIKEKADGRRKKMNSLKGRKQHMLGNRLKYTLQGSPNRV